MAPLLPQKFGQSPIRNIGKILAVALNAINPWRQAMPGMHEIAGSAIFRKPCIKRARRRSALLRNMKSGAVPSGRAREAGLAWIPFWLSCALAEGIAKPGIGCPFRICPAPADTSRVCSLFCRSACNLCEQGAALPFVALSAAGDCYWRPRAAFESASPRRLGRVKRRQDLQRRRFPG